MNRPKITHGEWVQNRKIPRMIHNEKHDQICEIDGLGEIPKEQEMANARFIAAAPKMAEALEAEEAWRDAAGEESERLRVIANEKRKHALIAAGYTFDT